MSTPLQQEFRDAMAGVATPVTVVTTLTDGTPHGTTVSAFASLSMEPPMVLVSLDQRSSLLSTIREGGRFGVNLLSHDQATVARAFASRSPDRFGGIDWTVAEGLPRLGGVAGWLACDVADLVTGGDHVIALGVVTAAACAASRLPHAVAAPLTYHAREFGTHVPLSWAHHFAASA